MELGAFRYDAASHCMLSSSNDSKSLEMPVTNLSMVPVELSAVHAFSNDECAKMPEINELQSKNLALSEEIAARCEFNSNAIARLHSRLQTLLNHWYPKTQQDVEDLTKQLWDFKLLTTSDDKKTLSTCVTTDQPMPIRNNISQQITCHGNYTLGELYDMVFAQKQMCSALKQSIASHKKSRQLSKAVRAILSQILSLDAELIRLREQVTQCNMSDSRHLQCALMMSDIGARNTYKYVEEVVTRINKNVDKLRQWLALIKQIHRYESI